MYAIFKVDSKSKQREVLGIFPDEGVETQIMLASEYFPEDRIFAMPSGKIEAEEGTLTGHLRASQDNQPHPRS